MTNAEIKTSIQLKPIAILGYGASGRGVRALAERMGIEATIFDQTEIDGTRQDFTMGDALQHSVAIISPALPEHHAWVQIAKEARLEIMGELDFGGLFLSKGVYAITGTDGKTVLSQFIAQTMNVTGQNAVRIGTNNRSLCEYLSKELDNEPTTRLVVEINSQQANWVKRLPIDGLIWTNFYPAHLDYHGVVESYFAAKFNLVERLVNSLLVVGQSVFEEAQRLNYPLPDYTLVVPNKPNSASDTLPEATILGSAPYDEDFRLAVAFGERIGIPRILWHQTAQAFQLPAHRFHKVAEISGVGYYNDAKSSTFSSAFAGLNHFKKPVLWIGGGESKTGDLSEFAHTIAPKIKAAYLIGASGGLMAGLLRREGVNATVFENLEEAFEAAHAESKKGDSILLSPGFSPRDQFENFSKRGNLFERLVLGVQALAREQVQR